MTAEEQKILSEVVGMFLGPPKKRKVKRLPPNRCIDCGKVSRTIRCDGCARARFQT